MPILQMRKLRHREVNTRHTWTHILKNCNGFMLMCYSVVIYSSWTSSHIKMYRSDLPQPFSTTYYFTLQQFMTYLMRPVSMNIYVVLGSSFLRTGLQWTCFYYCLLLGVHLRCNFLKQHFIDSKDLCIKIFNRHFQMFLKKSCINLYIILHQCIFEPLAIMRKLILYILVNVEHYFFCFLFLMCTIF